MLRHQQSRINALPVAVKALPEEEGRSVGDRLDDLKVGLKFLFTAHTSSPGHCGQLARRERCGKRRWHGSHAKVMYLTETHGRQPHGVTFANHQVAIGGWTMNKLAGFLLILSMLLVSSSAYANRYIINTGTCQREDAGTDDTVLLTLFYSESPGHFTGMLDRAGRDDFQRAQLEAFLFDTPTAGDIESAEVALIGNDGWCLVLISISDTTRGKVWTFSYNSWLDGNDNRFPWRISCTLPSPDAVVGSCSPL
jgi:PLAT/LH2 domain